MYVSVCVLCLCESVCVCISVCVCMHVSVCLPFELLAQLVGSLVSISEVRGSSLALSTTKNLSHTIFFKVLSII